MALGFGLMVIGMLGYVGSVLFTLMIDPLDIDEIRLATLMSFLSMMAFMLGAILEVKDLRNPISFEDKQTMKKEDSYYDEPIEWHRHISFIVIMVVLILLAAFILLIKLSAF